MSRLVQGIAILSRIVDMMAGLVDLHVLVVGN